MFFMFIWKIFVKQFPFLHSLVSFCIVFNRRPPDSLSPFLSTAAPDPHPGDQGDDDHGHDDSVEDDDLKLLWRSGR